MPDHKTESGHMREHLTRRQLAHATGCNIETIRYYEKTGMLPDPPRTDAGYRIYGADHVAPKPARK